MANNDWDLDDLLDFHFDREVPEKSKDHDILDDFEELSRARKPESRGLNDPAPDTGKGLGKTFDVYDELKLYEELRHQSSNDAPGFDAPASRPEPLSFDYGDDSFFDRYETDHKASRDRSVERMLYDDSPQAHGIAEEPDEPSPLQNVKEIEAIKQASRDAYDRYRSNYTKNKKNKTKRSGPKPVTGFDRVLTLIYLIAFGVFVVTMTIMNVLPFGMAIVLYGILVLISFLILIQTRKRNIKKWVRRLGRLTAVVLIALYGVGTAYALGTLSFLSDTSVDNANAVADITKDPFTFIITGIDVDGTIDEQGRSDVNMVVTVNPTTHQILMTSVPRDYEIYMPDFDNAMDKLTHTGFYGVPTTIGAEEQLFDMKVNYYVKVNFTTVERFIDAVGGVDVESEYEFNPVKMKDWTVQKGMNHMNGKQALAFARERKAFLTGDNQRIKNQQLVFEALIKKATSSRTMILNYNNVLSSLHDYFEMSFSSREIRRLFKMQLARNPEWSIFKNTVVGGDGSLPTYSTGGAYAYVMTQDADSIENAKTLMNAVLEGRILQTDADGFVTVAQGE